MSETSRISVAVVGAGGRMGRATVAAVRSADDMELVHEIGRDDSLRSVLSSSSVTVVVDFTAPNCVSEHLDLYLDLGVRPVIGTTGLSDAEFERLASKARTLGVGGIVAPNFAIGAVLMKELAVRAAQHLPDCEIIEFHHPQKVDAPSGTAIATRDAILATRSGPTELPIHSVRLPGFLAHQEVILGGGGERLSIRHDTMDRSCFMPGVLLSIRKVGAIRELIRGLEHFLK